MKNQKQIRCVMLVMLFVVASIFASGQVIIRNTQIGTDDNIKNKVMFNIPDIDMNKYDVYQDQHSKTFVPKMDNFVAKAGGEMYTITLNLEYNEEMYRHYGVALITNDSEIVNYAFSSSQDELIGQVPEGTYNIIFYFLSNGVTKAQYYVIKEDIEVTGDLTLTLNPIESTNHIVTKCYGPNGDLLKHELRHYDEEADEYVVDIPGDIRHTYLFSFLYQKGVGFINEYGDGVSGFVEVEEQQTVPFDIYVNDVSDQYAFLIARSDISEDLYKLYCTCFSTDNVNVGVLENNPNDYVQQKYNYKYTPYGCVNDGIQVGNLFWLIDSENEPVAIGFFNSSTRGKQDESLVHELCINVPDVDTSIPGLNIMVQDRIADHGIIDWGFEPTAWISGPPIRVRSGQKEYVNIGHTASDESNLVGNNLYYVKKDNSFFYSLLPSPDAYTYPTEHVLGDFGDNCPINALNVRSYKKGDFDYRMKFNSYFVGRYGEAFLGDMRCTTTGKFNGQEVDYSEFSPESKGKYEITVTNTNIKVDGLSGHNTTMVYFDQNQEDMTPPSIEMLHFKNGDGGVTDRFATASDGEMEFYASDFNYQYYPDLYNGVFLCQPVEVTVEYAPYGTEEWNELAVEEIPELYQEPGWGYFYRGSLAEVTGQGEQGWFDLKFRLVDASGNWQEQVISPAFRIDDLAYSSVATVGSDNAHEVARYNLAGQRVDASTPGVAIVKMSDGTARKVIVP